MEFEIKSKENDVTYQIPEIHFPSYEQYRQQAVALGEFIRSTEVTPENVKEAKSILADSRKVTDRLNRKRIDIKNDILRGYKVFEEQVKEITSIIDEADQELRGKVRELDDQEREAKKKAIRELWDKRVGQYDRIEKLIPNAFERWLEPSYLNKTASMKIVEAYMSKWLEDVDVTLDTASGMGDEYLTEYISTLSLTDAIRNVSERKKLENLINSNKEDFEDEPTATFIVTGEKDITLAEMLLKSNNITYRKAN